MSERASAPKQRLADLILAAFDHACDHGDLVAADQLLRVLEHTVNRTRAELERRRAMEQVIEAHSRLWHLRHAP